MVHIVMNIMMSIIMFDIIMLNMSTLHFYIIHIIIIVVTAISVIDFEDLSLFKPSLTAVNPQSAIC